MNIPHIQWQHRAGGICRFQTRVCGWRRDGTVVAQNNWLFTQHISKSFSPFIYNYNVTIHVLVVFSTPTCREKDGCRPLLSLHHYMTNSVQLPSTEGSGFMNPENYIQFAEPQASGPVLTPTFILNFTLPSSSTGFYIALQDSGGCILVSRLRVYRNNCRSRQIGLALYPDTPAPATGSVSVSIHCVENAEITGNGRATCNSDGMWTIPENSMCQCRPGYEQNSEFNLCGKIFQNIITLHGVATATSLRKASYSCTTIL